jgi:GT2 family glycosyltransferase
MNKKQELRTIAVIIPTFNREDYLRILLEQLKNQNQPAEIEVQPVIVLDGCTDGTSLMLATEFPSAHTVKGPGNWWWTKSVNEGIRYAVDAFQPDAILLLNDDSQILPDYLQCLISSSNQAGKDCIIASMSVTDKTPHRVSFSGIKRINWLTLKAERYHRSFELLDVMPRSGLFPTYALNGRGAFFRTSLAVSLGLLNEHSFPQYGSDDDLALRAWKKGYKVMISYSCHVIDRTGETSKGSALRRDGTLIFLQSFFRVHSVNYIPVKLSFFYFHGIKILMPFYFIKFLLGTSYAYFFKYKRLKHEL